MPSLRQKFDVSWNDGPKVRVVTSARDMALAQELMESPGLMAFAIVHAALKRTNQDVPEDFDEFLDQLDELDTIGGDTPDDPTQAVAGTNGQLPSLSQQGQISTPGLMTPAHS